MFFYAPALATFQQISGRVLQVQFAHFTCIVDNYIECLKLLCHLLTKQGNGFVIADIALERMNIQKFLFCFCQLCFVASRDVTVLPNAINRAANSYPKPPVRPVMGMVLFCSSIACLLLIPDGTKVL